jgi:hypothetical protein
MSFGFSTTLNNEIPLVYAEKQTRSGWRCAGGMIKIVIKKIVVEASFLFTICVSFQDIVGRACDDKDSVQHQKTSGREWISG